MSSEVPAVIKQTSTELAEYNDLIQDAGRGAENIDDNDVRPPRLMACQSGSPHKKPSNPKYIQGLNEMDLFNSLTGEIYGGTVVFTVIKSLGTHWMEFNADLTVKEANVPKGDPRTIPGEDANTGKWIKPQAVQFHDYLFFLPNTGEVVTFSFKSTQIKRAIQLNGLLRYPLRVGTTIIPRPPTWARTYQLTTKPESKNGFDWIGFNIEQIGVTDPTVRSACSELSKSFDKVKIEVERDSTDADATVDDCTQVSDDKVPF